MREVYNGMPATQLEGVAWVKSRRSGSQGNCVEIAELYLRWVRPGDIVVPKPHAAPAVHALNALMGILPPEQLTRLRVFGGLQSYLSRTKDPDPVDFSLGSMGLGPVARCSLAARERYLRDHFGARPRGSRAPLRGHGRATRSWTRATSGRRIEDESLHGLGRVTWIVDLNRQSLDRVIPGIRVRQLESTFAGRRLAGAGGQVRAAPPGALRRAAAAGPSATASTRCPTRSTRPRIRLSGAEARGAAARMAPRRTTATRWRRSSRDVPTTGPAGAAVRPRRPRPRRAGAGPRRGRRRPRATERHLRLHHQGLAPARSPGDALNHSALMNADQIDDAGADAGRRCGRPWAVFPADSPRSALLHASRAPRPLRRRGPARARRERGALARTAESLATSAGRAGRRPEPARRRPSATRSPRPPARPTLVERLVTTSADVSVSTNLGGWINRVGVYDPVARPVFDETPRLLRWQPGPGGSAHRAGHQRDEPVHDAGPARAHRGAARRAARPHRHGLRPVHRARPRRAHLRALQRVAVHPRGHAVGRVAGAGGRRAPVDDHAVASASSCPACTPTSRPSRARWPGAWRRASPAASAPRAGFSTYLRLTTRPVEQSLAEPVRRAPRRGRSGADRSLAGGYLMLAGRELESGLPADAPPRDRGGHRRGRARGHRGRALPGRPRRSTPTSSS